MSRELPLSALLPLHSNGHLSLVAHMESSHSSYGKFSSLHTDEFSLLYYCTLLYIALLKYGHKKEKKHCT
jgi:hypothetical protein